MQLRKIRAVLILIWKVAGRKQFNPTGSECQPTPSALSHGKEGYKIKPTHKKLLVNLFPACDTGWQGS